MKVTNIYFPTWQFCWWPFLGWLPFQSLSKLQIRGSKGHGLNHLQGHLQVSPTAGTNLTSQGFPRLSSTNCFIFLPIALGTAWVARLQCRLPVHTHKHLIFFDFFWKKNANSSWRNQFWPPPSDSFTEIPPGFGSPEPWQTSLECEPGLQALRRAPFSWKIAITLNCD